jgi:hypothetical protein
MGEAVGAKPVTLIAAGKDERCIYGRNANKVEAQLDTADPRHHPTISSLRL